MRGNFQEPGFVAAVETSLLVTKLSIPPARTGLVPRRRLIEQFQVGMSCSLMLVSAPAGFGKTTVLSEWTRSQRPPVPTAWVSLDKGENDPVRFWHYFIAALGIIKPGLGEQAVALLHSPQPPPIESVLIALINDITAVPCDFVLILDDYQFIEVPPVHAGVAFLLEHQPARLHLVIASRADPPLPLAHFRGRGMLLEIHADDLRFTTDEAASLLKELKGPELSAEDIGALNERTEGWAAGLKMAALSLRRERDIPGFIAAFTGSQRYIMDYLIEEVLRQQPEEVQDFLLKTSVLEKLTAPLCNAITGRTDSRSMLPNIERSNLFIVPLDESREWYRYEHLFAELLRHQLEISPGTDGVAGLHRLASRWYQDNGFPVDAIHHSLAASDWGTALGLLYDASERSKKTGELVTLLNWLRVVPREVLMSHHPLYINYGVALLVTYQFDAAEAVFKDLEPAAKEDVRTQGLITAYRVLIACYRWNLPLAMELAKKALPLLTSDDLQVRSIVSLNLGKVLWYTGRFKEAEPLLKEAYDFGRQTGSEALAATAVALLSAILLARGQPQREAELNEQATAESPAATMPHLHLGIILYERNELEAAASHLEKALELNRLMGGVEVQWAILSNLMPVRLALGDETGARETLKEMDQISANDSSPVGVANQAGAHLQMALAIGDITQAVYWGDRAAENSDYLLSFYRLLPVRLLIARGQKEKVPEQLRNFYESVHAEYLSPEWRTWLVSARIYLAMAAPTPDEALASFKEALTLARPLGLVRTFVDEGVVLTPLLREAVSHGIEPEYAARLLNIIEAEHRHRTGGRETPPSPGSGLLSAREVEVLRLIATGLSNRQIAERLFVSLGTAKVHVHNIFEKLNAASRTQAVARARELKLI